MPSNSHQTTPGLEGQSKTSPPSASKDSSEMPTSRRQSPSLTTNEFDSAMVPKLPDPPHVAAETQSNSSSSSLSSLELHHAPVSEQLEPNGVAQQSADKETSSAGLTATSSPYGTRLRNRAGASRPNYAEDKDLDKEFFEGSTGKREREDDSKKSTRQQLAASTNSSHGETAQTTAAPRPSNGSSRKPLPTEASPHHASGANSKEHNATAHSTTANTGNSTAAAAAAASATASSTPDPVASSVQPTRKRKAATHSQTTAPATNPVQPSSNGSTTIASQKKTSATLHGGRGYSETNMLTFENCKALPNKDGKMIADDGTVLAVNDHVYMVCEPPGEPYYLGRLMEFLHPKSDPTLPVDALRVNWFYRPKDIGRKVQDTRHVFATMHSDISPLTSLRGKCQIKHKAEIPNLAEYKRQPDSFWFEKLYDRYIQKNYEVIPTWQVINVPERVKKVLDERWKYILVEQGRGKEFTSAVKLCKRCTGYCASNDSVDCAVCGRTYHMNCVRPPLLKKPSRGFGWSCAACSRAQERKLEARNTPTIAEGGLEAEEEEFLDDEEDDVLDTCRNTPIEENHPPATAEQIYQCSLWPYRYLGIHCKVEDALDYDDRIFPRASTRLGPRHQANVVPWYGRPVVYEKPVEFKKVGRKNDKANREIMAAMEAERLRKEKRAKWIQDTPPGYIERGGDYDEDDPRCTSKLLWKPPQEMGVDIPDEAIDDYMHKAKSMATSLGLPPRSTNLQDVARDILFRHKFDTKKALEELPKVDKAEFKEPELTPAEQKRFEEGVAKYGSELHLVMKHVKTAKPATITRYYYTWKKTDRGKQVWGNYSNRKGKKDAKKVQDAAKKLADDVADDIDDSAFDESKAAKMKKGFICKFCSTKHSRQWRRAPAHVAMVSESGGRKQDKDKNNQYIQALCRRCAELWRRYAIQWEDIDEVAKKVAQTGGKGWRKKVDEELYKELIAADEMMKNTRYSTPPPASTTASSSAAASINGHHPHEPPRKKQKSSTTASLAMAAADRTNKDSDGASDSSMVSTVQAKKKDKAVEKSAVPTPPPVPVIPKAKVLPCAVCLQMEPLGDQHVSCKECRMSVHRNCYGIIDQRAPGKWTCDMCLNDKNPQVAIQYKCVLCPVEYTEHDFVELPKVSHKKKTEKEKEREKAEREAAFRAAEYYRKRQEDMGRPLNPREPLKRTADNNWVHVTCAVFTPEVKFGMAKALSPAENIPSIPRSRYTEICKACKTTGGACVSCQQCKAPVHVECAHQAGYFLGFDITPVKSSRRDQHNIVTIGGEVGVMSAGIWCKEHTPTKSSSVHRMHELVDDSGANVLQLYAQKFKQADLTLSGCARKANQISLAGKAFAPVPQNNLNRRASTTTIVHGGGDSTENVAPAKQSGEKICLTCGVEVSPKWYPINQDQERGLINGSHGNIGSEAQKFVEQRSFQCHKCKKTNRQPKPHQVKEPTPKPEPMQLDATPAVISPPPPVLEPDHGRQHGGPYSWSPAQQVAGLVPSGAVPPPSQLQAPAIASMVAPMISPVHGPPMAPHSLPQNGLPRTGPSMPSQPYHSAPVPPHQGHPYGDWQRHPQHGQLPYGPAQTYAHRDINGGPPPSLQQNGPVPHGASLHHLRPPSMSSMAYPPPPPPVHHSSHMAQPPPSWMNGYPPSPRRMSAGPPPPPPPNGASYPPVYHGLTQAPDYRNGAGPAQIPVHREPHPMYSAHGSPSAPPAPLPREQSHPPPPPRENRQASGASASPSVANLLS